MSVASAKDWQSRQDCQSFLNAMKTAIVTDSTADIAPQVAETLGIRVIPAIVVVDGQSYEDGQGLSRREFYERLPEMKRVPTTASPPAGKFEAAYRQMLDSGYDAVVSIHVSSTLSSICDMASLGARPFGERVQVIDSEQLTLGIGFQAIAAAELAAQGAPMDEIIARVADTRRRARVYAMLDTLEYVRRSGRVGWARARIGALLRIKPFVEVYGGRVLDLGKTRTRRKGIAHLLELLEGLGPLERLAILHTNAEEDALTFRDRITWEHPPNPPIVNVTTVIGTHVGPNGLGFAVVLKDVAD